MCVEKVLQVCDVEDQAASSRKMLQLHATGGCARQVQEWLKESAGAGSTPAAPLPEPDFEPRAER